MSKSVSVVIPVRNEEKYISKCIDSLLNQDYPSNLLEIILVDGISEDSTTKIINRYIKDNTNVKMLFNERKITPISLNIGIKHSNNDVIIILGAHSYVDNNFVKNNIRNLNRNDIDVSGGIVKFINENTLTKCIGLATSCPFGAGNAYFRYATEERLVDTVPFAAYKRDIFSKIGYFDEQFIRNQDDELNFRISESGRKILLSPDIISYYYSRSSLEKLWKQYYQYGFWKVRVMQKHGKTASIRHLIPLFFVLINIFGIALGIFFKPILLLWLFEICLYLALALYYSLKLCKKELGLVKYILLCFPILHLSYGFGFIEGIFKFYIIKSKEKLNKDAKM